MERNAHNVGGMHGHNELLSITSRLKKLLNWLHAIHFV